MGSHVPSSVTEAVLVPSEEVPQGAKQVTGIDFNQYGDRDITAAEMVDAMAGMGFQASAIGDAARIINEMVRARLKFPPGH
jgi:deoxyhypusine synthase